MGKNKRFFNEKDQFIASVLNNHKVLKDVMSVNSVS